MLLFDTVLSCHKLSAPQGCTRFEVRSLPAAHWCLPRVPTHQLDPGEAASGFSPRGKAAWEGQAEIAPAILAEHGGV